MRRKKKSENNGFKCLAFLFRYDGRCASAFCADHVCDSFSGAEKL